MPRKALIVGVSGQDGAYLARFLLAQGYEVFGSSRDALVGHFGNLRELGIAQRVQTLSLAPADFRSCLSAIVHTAPDEVYNLAGQSSVGLSFEQPVETIDSVVTATLNLLEAIRFNGRPVRFYNASSGECFGDTEGVVTEDSPFRPRSPYAVAKSAAHWLVANYREGYGLHASSGILFNHESPLRPERFVTRKVVAAATRIHLGNRTKLRLGNLGVRRDWGWAPEYVEAMWRMLQQDQPGDLVIATGETRSLREFVAGAFGAFGLSWEDHVIEDPSLLRPSDLRSNAADPGKAAEVLGWKATVHMEGVVQRMVEAELERLRAGAGTAS